MQVGSFGEVVFEVSDSRVITPTDVQRERKARYEEHKVIGAAPRLEFLAPELADLTMRICLRKDMGVNPVSETTKLSKYCRDGKVCKLILAGINCGDQILESVSQSWRHTGPNGPHTIELVLKFKEYA